MNVKQGREEVRHDLACVNLRLSLSEYLHFRVTLQLHMSDIFEEILLITINGTKNI